MKEPGFSGEQDAKITNLLNHGGGVSLDQMIEAAELSEAHAAELEPWLIAKIATGQVRRVWNGASKTHFYMTA